MKILDKALIADSQNIRIGKLEVFAPDIAKKALPGQFIALMASANGERIPLTVVDKNIARGSVTLIFQEAGLTTKMLGQLKAGDSLYSLVGPLGHPTHIQKYGRVIIVGGGVGIAEIYPVARALRDAGNYVVTILGARNKDLLILEKELKSVSDELHIATDDGSYGRKGFTLDILKELLTRSTYEVDKVKDAPGLIYAVGPIPMMERVAAFTKEYGIKTIVSLNAIMVDATGMCGCCRVTVGGKTRFSCVDGPEFDGHEVDWEELKKRNRIYNNQEQHICKLGI